MIALAGYQFALFRRGRLWLVPALAGLAFLLSFYLLVARDHPGSYLNGGFGMFGWAVLLSAVLALDLDPALWQVAVVAAGSAQRAQLSRAALAAAGCVLPALLTALVTAAGHLGGRNPAAAVLAGWLWYLLLSGLGCLLGAWVGGRLTGRASWLVTVVLVALSWELALR